MALKKLKKGLEDAQAFQDKSSGKDTLREVLVDMAKAGPVLSETVPGEIISATLLNSMILPFPVRVVSLTIVVFDTGDSGQTDVVVDSALGDHALASIDNAEADGTVKTALGGVGVGQGAEIPANTEFSLRVTAAPGASSGNTLTATALLSPIDIE